MITDKHGKNWTPNAERTLYTCDDGVQMVVNPEWSEEAIIDLINHDYVAPKTDAERIAELEAQLAALLSRL
jgi:hypothetical protein